MTDNEILLQDRVQKIQQIINQYGEENFYLSFSGGKDSTVLSWLIDHAMPNNKIPRVYADTGIELNMVRDFVFDMAKRDDRVVIIKPSKPIKQTLDNEGYPFKSKGHSVYVDLYQRKGKTKSVIQYLGESKNKTQWAARFSCPNMLRYQFSEDFKLKVSDNCCHRLKTEPLAIWQHENNKPYSIVGIMQAEGGRRSGAQCLAFNGNKLKAFQPLAIITKEWEEWLIKEYNIDICDIYKPPYNFERTGCKGCPFTPWLQKDLDTLEKFFPNERKQCETIWKPVYDEYRRLGYRLNKNSEYEQLELF